MQQNRKLTQVKQENIKKHYYICGNIKKNYSSMEHKCMLKKNKISLCGLLMLTFAMPLPAKSIPVIKSVRKLIYEAVPKDSTWVTGKVVDYILFTKYDSLGRELVENALEPDGSPHHKAVYLYDKEGRVSRDIYATAREGVKKCWVYQYDEAGRMNCMVTMDGKEDTLSVSSVLYNEKGLIGKRLFKDYTNGTTIGTQLVYDDKGVARKKIQSFPGNQKLVTNDWITEGDTASLQRPVFISTSRRLIRPLNPVKVKRRVTEVDGFGNWTEMIQYTSDSITPEYIIKRDIVYAGMDNDWDKMHLHGKVKRLRQSSYIAIPKGPQAVDKGKKKGLFFVYGYDDKGRKTEEETFSDTGVPMGKIRYEYGGDGTLQKEVHQSPAGVVEKCMDYRYGGGRRLRACSISDGKGDVQGVMTYRYDVEDNRVGELGYRSDGTKYKDIRYKYDSYGHAIEKDVILQPESEAKEYPFRCSWNFQGRLLAKQILLLPGVGRDNYTYRYNPVGQVISGTEQLDGQPEVKYVYKFFKDDKGNWKIRIKYVGDVPVLYEEREYTYYND
jgi:hypothetical protein